MDNVKTTLYTKKLLEKNMFFLSLSLYVYIYLSIFLSLYLDISSYLSLSFFSGYYITYNKKDMIW